MVDDVVMPPPGTSPPPDYVYPNMIRRAGWGAEEADHTAENEHGFYSAENPEGWLDYGDYLDGIFTTVVLHHSVIYEGDDVSTMHEIQRLHQEDNGWADVGYHYVIGKQGAVYEGRDIHARGVHVAGYNSGTLGVCLMGNFMEEQPTESQIKSARELIQWLAPVLGLTHLGNHRAFNPTTRCPGDNLVQFASAFATNAGLEVGIDGYVPPDGTESAALCPCCMSPLIT